MMHGASVRSFGQITTLDAAASRRLPVTRPALRRHCEPQDERTDAGEFAVGVSLVPEPALTQRQRIYVFADPGYLPHPANFS